MGGREEDAEDCCGPKKCCLVKVRDAVKRKILGVNTGANSYSLAVPAMKEIELNSLMDQEHLTSSCLL